MAANASLHLLGSPDYTSQIQEVEKRARKQAKDGSGCKLMVAIASLAFAICNFGFLAPPPPKICGTLHGPSVTAPSVKLSDGRPLAYAQAGASLRNATHKVIVVHNYGSSRLEMLPVSRATLEELGVLMASFDRAGYGESHPSPHRSVESEARDIEDLADQLFGNGAKFYVIGVGIGSYSVWSCLKYIPHRLSGVAMVAPVANFWWNFPEARAAFSELSNSDKSVLMVAHYVPSLLYWWTTQKWFPESTIVHLSASNKMSEVGIQQGVHESLHRDLMVHFGSWKFDPSTLENREAVPTHIWHSTTTKDGLFFPVKLQRQLKSNLPWINCHDVPETRHYIFEHRAEDVLAALVSSS